MRKKIIAGNWKMNKNLEEGLGLVSEISNMLKDEYSGSAKVVIIPPFLHVAASTKLVAENSRLATGAQNCSNHKSGAYTGEISADMIMSCGATYVIIGHSERRQYFNETNDWLAKKIDAVLEAGLTPIYCCGETLEERETNAHFTVLETQISEGLFHLNAEQMAQVVIAYEPVWAIGTGKTASTEQAQEIHAFIRGLIGKKYSSDLAEEITIQYGGSVKPDNAKELFSAPDIDGALIGGAALQSRSFVDIIKSMN
ncbi:MAG: triose-phosphate isomerase [Bacteroidia bacterium]|nr:triose-phosphate isomerase [Bacteroidia bacterium]MCF8426835.1 triose-phosphate isomerase [Bacteroidia bacterium]MCF8446797.1 triose-phosphate isomerase [Bacteroidia bacterium]